MGPVGMGKGGGAFAPGKFVKWFSASAMTVKHLVDELFIFKTFVGFWGLRSQSPIGAPFMDPTGGRKPQTPNLPTPKKSAYKFLYEILCCC